MTLVERDLKFPFSIATTPKSEGGRYSFPRLPHFTLDPFLIMLNVKQGGIKYQFWVFGMTRLGIEPRSRGPLANTLLIRSTTVSEFELQSFTLRLILRGKAWGFISLPVMSQIVPLQFFYKDGFDIK